MTNPTYVLAEEHAGWIELTLNRPANFNALSEGMLEALQGHLTAISQRDDLLCVIIKATGKAFCAGHDLKEMQATINRDYYHTLFATCSHVMQSIVNLPIPVIAQVQGIATAAGCQLVASCDLAVASDNARFAVSGINLGLFCSTPAVALSRNIHPKHALEMLLTGEFISADSALQKGLINKVCDPDDLNATTRSLAQTICTKIPVAVKTGKALFYPQLQHSLKDAYTMASHAMVDNLMHADTQAGIHQFVHKSKSTHSK